MTTIYGTPPTSSLPADVATKTYVDEKVATVEEKADALEVVRSVITTSGTERLSIRDSSDNILFNFGEFFGGMNVSAKPLVCLEPVYGGLTPNTDLRLHSTTDPQKGKIVLIDDTDVTADLTISGELKCDGGSIVGGSSSPLDDLKIGANSIDPTSGYVKIQSDVIMSDQTLRGSEQASGFLRLSSTSHGTKGQILILDEVLANADIDMGGNSIKNVIDLKAQTVTATGGLSFGSITAESLKILKTLQYGPSFQLTPTWVVYGDSFSIVNDPHTTVNWTARLASLTSTTVINRAVSGTRITALTSSSPLIINDAVNNPAYDVYSTIIAYGVNDVRGAESLYTNPYMWQQVYLNTVVTASLPQANISDTRTWNLVGGWGNTSVANHGVYTSGHNAYAEKTLVGRYYAFSFIIYHTAVEADWEITVNGIDQCVNKRTWAKTTSEGNYYGYMILVDMGFSGSRTIRVINRKDNGAQQFFQYCGVWDDTTVGFKSVLCLGIPKMNYGYTGASGSIETQTLMDNAIQDVVRTTRALRITSHYLPSINMGCFVRDQLHWSEGAHIQRAQRIKDIL